MRGVAGSAGIAIGQATVFGALEEVHHEPAPGEHWTLEDFHRALAKTEQQLEALQLQMDERLADVASMIFSAHLLIVKDSKFSGAMVNLIKRA
jgi:phosphotransferase system enzyme I (PtsP)